MQDSQHMQSHVQPSPSSQHMQDSALRIVIETLGAEHLYATHSVEELKHLRNVCKLMRVCIPESLVTRALWRRARFYALNARYAERLQEDENPEMEFQWVCPHFQWFCFALADSIAMQDADTEILFFEATPSIINPSMSNSSIFPTPLMYFSHSQWLQKTRGAVNAENRALFDRCTDAGTPTLKRLLDKGADPNTVCDEGETALSIACSDYVGSRNYRGVPLQNIQLLLSRGADPNRSETSTITIAMSGPMQLVRLLIDHGADPNRLSAPGGSSTLIEAIRDEAPVENVILLIASGADVEMQSREGQYPLCEAIRNAHRDMQTYTHYVEALLLVRANPNRMLDGTHTCLEFAASRNYLEIARLLLQHGAERRRQTRRLTLTGEMHNLLNEWGARSL